MARVRNTRLPSVLGGKLQICEVCSRALFDLVPRRPDKKKKKKAKMAGLVVCTLSVAREFGRERKSESGTLPAGLQLRHTCETGTLAKKEAAPGGT